MKILVISSNYPAPDLLYGDSFVHVRLMEYKKYFKNIAVAGYSNGGREISYEFEGIPVTISAKLDTFRSNVLEHNPDIILCHLIQHEYVDFLISLGKQLVVFAHGYDTTSWRRRLMNYTSVGALPYLWRYALDNSKQMRALRKLARLANKTHLAHFVFVSDWLMNAVEEDLGFKLRFKDVIHNGIDTSRFSYQRKSESLRKKILLIRSFKARNYANDIAVNVILLLSKKPFFNDLEFAIYGEGYLFRPLTAAVSEFPNVKLFNFFVENKAISSIHQNYGIFLCPSRLDSQGVSMCEAMSSGLIPITCPTGGIPEFVSNNVSGFMRDTAGQMAKDIEFLYNNPEEFSRVSRNARTAIESKSELSAMVRKEIDVINSLTMQNRTVAEYQQCSRCILDTRDEASISFDDKGVCSYCRKYDLEESRNVKTDASGQRELEKIIHEIKTTGSGKRYDCILGVSGGVDSTYLALMAKRLGLRPLAVHFDNGWNSELAVANIENIIGKLGFDLHTEVIDWEEFRDLQLAFLKASVVDIELITDHAIMATLYTQAIKNDIKFILSGANFATESVLPSSWIHDKRDHLHIREINKLFGTRALKKYPLFDSTLKLRGEWHGIKSVSLLNYFPYIKADVKAEIIRELNWRDYGGKHYESVFTRFYQGYILPEKFGIDKRKAHLSNLICSKQITREDALKEISGSPYPEALRKTDYDFVLKKLKLSREEFEIIMQLPIRKHSDYPIDSDIYERYPILRFFSPAWKMLKKMRRKL